MKSLFLLIFISSVAVLTTAQINIRSVKSYDIKDGLSQTSVHSIYEDSRGLLWFGTEGGLHKYNGYEITSFHSFDKQNILSSRGAIYNILEDSNHNIWFGSTGILSRLNIHTETVDNLHSLLEDKSNLDLGVVLGLLQGSKGNIWFGTFGNGFFKVSADLKSITNYKNTPDSTADTSLEYVRSFYEDETGILWIATYGGLVKFNPATEEIINIFYFEKFAEYKHTTIFQIIPFAKNELLLFTRYQGILVYNSVNNTLEEFDGKLNAQLKNATLRDAQIDKDGRIWATAYGAGVFVINPETKDFQNLADVIEQTYKSSLLEALSLHVDPSGIVWVGTQHSGLLKLILGKKYIHTANNTVSGFEKIESNVVNAVAKDSNGIVWFSTNSGLYKLDRMSNNVQKLDLSRQFSSVVFKMYNIEFTKENAWLSLGPYLVKHDLHDDMYEMTEIESNGTITEIYKVNEDKLVIGTVSGNLYLYGISNGEIDEAEINSTSTTSSSILDCYLAADSLLWIGTNNGLFYVNLSEEKLKIEDSNINLRLDFITSITSNDKETIWFGTYGDGIFSYNTQNANLDHFTNQDGLLDNTIYGVMFDSENKLWMSSNRGVIEFDPQTKIVRTMDVSDGFHGYENNSKAYSKSFDGEMYYGGLNGFSYFYPKDIVKNNIAPSILIDNVIIYDSIIVRNVSEGFDEIFEFNYDANSLSFEYTALDFMDPEKNSYEYKLEGVNENWIKAGNKRYATFPNINPGKYRFVVRGTNSDQVLNETGASFSFVILPPFWASWWFRSILISITLLIVYSIYKFRMISQEKRLREIETIRKNIADDFHDDLGHKLTRISLYSELIKNQKDLGTDKNLYLAKISEASNSLFYETKDFIWSIDPGNDTVYDVLIYMKDFGDDFFNRSGIAFKVDEIGKDLKRFTLPMKWKREIVLIFKEAMNNVIKHSKASTAEIKTNISGPMLTISLCDNGVGFDASNNDLKGRGLISINKRTDTIGGTLNIESDNLGTRIHLSFKPDEAKR